MTRYAGSREWYDQARRIIPWGTQTRAKWPEMFGDMKNHMPLYIDRAKGARFWDIDGNEFIDYHAALGPVILGYAFDEVDEAVRAQMAKGALFSMASPIEYEVAKLLVEVVPCAEQVRFLKTGVDAVAACVRLARACTGKEKILSCGYHGWHDIFFAGAPADRRGIPQCLQELIIPFKYNDLDGVRETARANRGQIAAMVVNAFAGDPPAGGFLEGLREIATDEGMVLIFDEVKTGFRLALGGAQERFRVTPDLAAFSKAMANGYPLAAFAGCRRIMGILEEYDPQGENVTITTTFAGETLSLAAALATIGVLKRPGTYETMRATGRALMDGLRERAAACGLALTIRGVETWFSANLAGRLKNGASADSLFRRGLLDGGIFCHKGTFEISLSHGARETAETLAAAAAAMERVKAELA